MRHSKAIIAACLLTSSLLCPGAGWAADSATRLLTSGTDANKKVLVLIGDGFTAADQNKYNSYVENTILNGTFHEGPLWEGMNAFNIIRINVESNDSGVTEARTTSNAALTPDAPADGVKTSFTFSPVSPLPVLHGRLVIKDPAGTSIEDSGGYSNTGPLTGTGVTGTFNYVTGVASLTYTTPPPAGNFTITYTAVTVARDTRLEYIFNDDWNRCWFDIGENGQSKLDTILNTYALKRDYVIVILNEPGFGGCGGGGGLTVTMGGDWSLPAHETGHMVGGLCDEYGGDGTYTGPEPGCPNMTINTNRSTVKWADFIAPTTAIPTIWNSGTMDQSETVGEFEGGYYKTYGVYRPHYNGRMNGNSPPFGPVSYDAMKAAIAVTHEHNFAKTLSGDFNGDGRADLVIHNANALELYQSDGNQQVPTWIQTLPLTGWDSFAEHDQFLVTDFDGNGRDDLIVYNMVDFAIPYLALLRSADPPAVGFTVVVRYDNTLPGWQMKPGDKFFVGDFDGDTLADLYVVNNTLTDWPIGYLGMLRSTGGTLAFVKRYDDILPGWDKIRPGDQFYVANVNGTGGKDLYVSNTTDWCVGYVDSLLSTGTELTGGARYDQTIPGWANILPGDTYLVGDLNGDGREDLYAFNGTNYPVPYLGVLRSSGVTGTLDVPILHESTVDGWGAMKANDHFLAANIDGVGGRDLYVYNLVDWSTKFIGQLQATQYGFVGNLQANTVGKWTLGVDDTFLVANVDGKPTAAPAMDDLVVHNDSLPKNEFLGLLVNTGSNLSGPVLYNKWIHHYLYHASGMW
jgi:hypothetical protein